MPSFSFYGKTITLVLVFVTLLSIICPTISASATPVEALEFPDQPCAHQYETVVTAPTCTRTGHTTYMCLKCGDKYTGNVVPALGHDFKDGICTHCEARENLPPIISVALQKQIGTMDDETRIVVAFDLKEFNQDSVLLQIAEESGLDAETIEKVFEARASLEESMAYINAKRNVLRRLYTEYNREFLMSHLSNLRDDCLLYVADTHATIWAALTKAEILYLAGVEQVISLGFVAQNPEDMIAENAGMDEDSSMILQLREDYFEKLRNEGSEFPKDATVNNVIIAYELGRFHDVWIGTMVFNYYPSSPGFTYFIEEVDGVQFRYPKEMGNDTVWGVVYFDRQFYTLQEAFEQGVLTHEDLIALQKSASVPFRFEDVKDDEAFYFEPVYWAVDQKITTGTSKNLFSPDASCTRAQVVTFLWRAAGEPEPTKAENPFKDVAEDAYYYNAVLWAVEKGITKGTSAGAFSPEATCTRAQIVTFLYRANGTPEVSRKSKPFTDVDAAQYYADAVAWAVENGVTTGKSPETFAPSATCTRGEIVTFLYRSYTGSKPQNPDTAGGPPVYYTASSVEELTQWIKTAEVEPSYNWGSLYPFLKAARDLGQILAVYPASEDYSLQEILVQCNREQMDYFFVKGNERLEVLVELPGTDGNPKLSLDERIGQINSDLALEYESLQYAKASATVNGKETDVYYYDGGEYTKKGSEQKELFGPSAFFGYEGHVVLIRGIGSLYGCKWDSTYLGLFQFDFVELE